MRSLLLTGGILLLSVHIVWAQLSAPEIKVEAANQATVKNNGGWQLKFINEVLPSNSWYLGASNDNWSPTDEDVNYFAIGIDSQRYPKMAMNRNGQVIIGHSTVFDGSFKIASRIGDKTAMIVGSNHTSYFCYTPAQNTYIRGGLLDSKVYLADEGSQSVVIGRSISGTSNDNRAALTVHGGAVMAEGDRVWAASDQKLKKNIKNYDKGLSTINNINIVSYDLIKDSLKNDSDQIGVIAQELQEAAPHLVRTFKVDKSTGKKDKHGSEVLEMDGNEILAIDVDGLTFLLVNAVKEQQAMIEALQAEIKNLKEVKSK